MAKNLTPETLFGATVTDRSGDKIGKVEDVYLDNRTGEPEWVSVKTGLFGSGLSLVPLAEASSSAEGVSVPFEKAMVKDAPHYDAGVELTENDESDLYAYYGIADPGASGQNTDQAAGRATDQTMGQTAGRTSEKSVDPVMNETMGQAMNDTMRDDSMREDATASAEEYQGTNRSQGQGYDTSGANTDTAMTRSKEELRVGTETREAGRARLRKYITTESVSRTVPVSHEEVVVTREPITEANRGDAMAGGELTEEEHEIVLTEERATAEKDVVAVERVQLGTENVEGTETIEADLREEQIDLDADAGVKTGGGTGRQNRTDRA